MDAGADARGLQRLLHLIAVRQADRIDMINVPAVRGRRRPREWMLRQQAIVMSSH